MVKIALAGGGGNVGREILDVLVGRGKHEIVVFSRQETPELAIPGAKAVQVDYLDRPGLVEHLRGVQVVLSFIVTMADPDNISQKNLIDACIEAGVSRFAPSEWATASHCGIPSYQGKDEVYDYLQLVNKEKPVLEYTLFQPGLFLNYFSYPHRSTTHMHIFPMPIDLSNCRAIVQKDTKARITLTTVQDLARVVAEAVEYSGKWPEIGGIRGNQILVLDFINVCSRVKGHEFEIEEVEKADLEKGKLAASWIPLIDHPAVPEAHRVAFSESYFANFILAFEKGAWDVSDEWNERLPGLGFTGVEEFLSQIWGVRP